MLILSPPCKVNDAGFISLVVATRVAPAGIAAVAPETSTQTSFGKYLKDTIQVWKVVGTVMLVALPTVRVAEYFTVLGCGAKALYPC
jgi:hypothetical protein